MATVLYDVITAEMRSALLEPALVANITGSGDPKIDNEYVRTGSWAYSKSSRPKHMGVLNPSDECIVGAWINTKGIWGSCALISGWAEDPGSPGTWRVPLYVWWEQTAHELTLYVDDTGPFAGSPNFVQRDQISEFQTPINQKVHWMHLGVYANHAVNPTISVYLDGQQILTWTSVAGTSEWLTAVEVWDFINAVSISTIGWFTDTYIDDMYSADVTGDGDQIPPALRFVPSLSDGAGGSAQWTPDSGSNYARVNETTVPDGDTSYVETATTAQKDLYTFADIAAADLAENYTVGEVIMQSEFKNVDDGEVAERAYEHVVNDGSLESVDGTFSNSTLDTWTFAKSIFPLQPDGSAWNLADYNAWEYGINSK